MTSMLLSSRLGFVLNQKLGEEQTIQFLIKIHIYRFELRLNNKSFNTIEFS